MGIFIVPFLLNRNRPKGNEPLCFLMAYIIGMIEVIVFGVVVLVSTGWPWLDHLVSLWLDMPDSGLWNFFLIMLGPFVPLPLIAAIVTHFIVCRD